MIAQGHKLLPICDFFANHLGGNGNVAVLKSVIVQGIVAASAAMCALICTHYEEVTVSLPVRPLTAGIQESIWRDLQFVLVEMNDGEDSMTRIVIAACENWLATNEGQVAWTKTRRSAPVFHQINVRVPRDLHARLKKEAGRRKRLLEIEPSTIRAIVEDALSEFLQERAANRVQPS